MRLGNKHPGWGCLIGDKSHTWKGGRYQDKRKGYWLVYAPDHHRAHKNKHVYEHIIVYEKYHKCCVLSWGEIHHKNKKPWDNKPENLQLVSGREHRKLHRIVS